MRIALLSAGPSLRRVFDPAARFDVRIGVNTAAAAFACDWWSCGDAQTFAEIVPVGFPDLFTMTESDSNFHRPGVWDRLQKHRMVLWNEVRDRQHPPQGVLDWSVTAALALAVDLGATLIDVFGHDMAGTTDSAGRELTCRQDNWRRVEPIWRDGVRWAQQKGVLVIEHQPLQRTEE